MRPKKSIGQNFLRNTTILGELADAYGPQGNGVIIEIGPGHGELTKELRTMNEKSRIIAIEKDERLAAFLKERFKNDENTEIVAGDALKVLPELVVKESSLLQTARYLLVGNIPYYLTGYLLRIASELRPRPKKIIFTVQEEVAKRVCAVPPKMNLLAASVQFWAAPKVLAKIDRREFNPIPKVDSAVVEIVPLPETVIEPDVFYDFIAVLFGQPRKTVLNNLAASNLPRKNREELAENIRRLGVSPTDRPQNLTVTQITRLAEQLREV